MYTWKENGSTGPEWARLRGSALRQGQRDGWGQRMLALKVLPTHLYVFPASHRKTSKSFKEDTIESHLHLRRINQGPRCWGWSREVLTLIQKTDPAPLMAQYCQDKRALSDTQAGPIRSFTGVSKVFSFHLFPWKLSAFSIAPITPLTPHTWCEKGVYKLQPMHSLLLKAGFKMAAWMQAWPWSQSGQRLPRICGSSLAGNSNGIKAFILCEGCFWGSTNFCFMVKSKNSLLNLLSCDHIPYFMSFTPKRMELIKYKWMKHSEFP